VSALLPVALLLAAQEPLPAPAGDTSAASAPRIVRPAFDRTLGELDQLRAELRPPLRNFFPPLGAGIDAQTGWRSSSWELAAGDAALAAEAARVARELAPRGLLATVHALLATDPARSPADWRARLPAIGIPLELLDAFRAPDGGEVLAWLARTPAPEFDACTFAFAPSVPGFQAASESGEHAIGALRMQLTNGHYWLAPGDGGSLDLARQLLEALPGVPILAALEERHLAKFEATARAWPAGALTVLVQDMPVSQWAQDDGKSGLVGDTLLTLAPRYACRGEEASGYVAGELRALEAFALQGQRVARSPLLFQGGNLIVVTDPARQERVLLAGEGEVLRNVALGLTRAQVLEALRVEFGVARVLELPAIAYHIDYEVSPRVVDGRLVCFVNDPWPAVRAVLSASVAVLERARHLDAQQAARVRAALPGLETAVIVETFSPLLMAQAVGPGQFRESFARLFQDGAGDSHIANFHRLLLVLDLLLAREPASTSGDRHTQAYLGAARRREADRAEFVRRLAAQGWRIEPVPGLSEGGRGLTYLNGVQARDLYLMPAWGGLFAELDREVRAAFERVCGPGVRVVPILSGESQRRSGAVRCSVSVLPRP